MSSLKYLPATLIIASSIANAKPMAIADAKVTNWPNTKILTSVQLRSHHVYTISNDTPGDKMFYIKMTLCPVDQKSLCVEKREFLGLAQGQFFTHDADLATNVVFRAVGDHSVIATTEVTGGATGFAQQQRYVWVHY